MSRALRSRQIDRRTTEPGFCSPMMRGRSAELSTFWPLTPSTTSPGARPAFGGRAVLDAGHQGADGLVEAEVLGQLGVEALDRHAQAAAGDLAVFLSWS